MEGNVHLYLNHILSAVSRASCLFKLTLMNNFTNHLEITTEIKQAALHELTALMVGFEIEIEIEKYFIHPPVGEIQISRVAQKILNIYNDFILEVVWCS